MICNCRAIKLILFVITLCAYNDYVGGDKSKTLSRQRRISRKNPSKLLEKFSKTIDEGKGQVDIADGEVILVMGNINSGKTTLTKYLAEDNTKLRSVRNKYGKFIIQDEDGSINTSAYKPKTTLPELVFDSERNQTYYDCPAFNINDNIVEITSAYFIQEILYHANSFKIILTIDYSLVKNNSSSKHLLDLVESPSRFLKNVDKYNESIALVVTKVDAQEDDQQVIHNVGKFIMHQKEKLTTIMNKTDKRAVKILEILSSKSKDVYRKIGIFRKPDKLGYLDSIDLLQSSKHTLYQLIDDLVYSPNSAYDFGNVLDKRNYLDIRILYKISHQNIATNMKKVFDEIYKYSDISLENSHDIFITLKDNITTSLINLQECLEFRKLQLANIIYCISRFEPGVYDIDNSLSLASSNLEYLEVLKSIGKWNGVLENIKYDRLFIEILQSLIENTADFVAWRQFSSIIYDRFNSYEIQKNRLQILSNNRFLTRLGEDNYHQLLTIVNSSEKLSLSKPPSSFKISVLDRLVKTMLRYEIIYNCESPNKLTLKGSYLILSQISISGRCPDQITDVEIFAFYKIFMDSMPSTLRSVNVAVISPEAEEVGGFRIMQYKSDSGKRFWFLAYTDLVYKDKFDFYLHTSPCQEKSQFTCYKGTLTSTINSFKTYVLENTSIQKTRDMEYFKKLNKRSWGFMRIYNTTGFIEEFKALERSFYRLRERVDFLPLYQTLLERIEAYAENPDEDTDENIVILRYLYSATLSKVCSIQNNMDNDLIINIGEYMNFVIENIKEFKESTDKVARNKLMVNYKETFDKQIEQKISEATVYIDNYISPEVDQLMKDIDSLIEDLHFEIQFLEAHLEQELEYAERKFKELETTKNTKTGLGVLSVASSILGFFGPVGMAVSKATSIGLGVAKKFLPDSVKFDRESMELPAGVRKLLEKTEASFQMIKDIRIRNLENDIADVLNSLKNKTDSGNYHNKFLQIQLNLRRIKLGKASLDDIEILRSKFNTEYQNLKNHSTRSKRFSAISSVQNVIKDYAINAAKIIYDKAKGSRKVAESSEDIFNKAQSGGEKLEAISKVKKQQKANLDSIRKYEDKIFQIVTPTLKNMQSYVNDLRRDAKVQSEIGMIVSKWEMKRILRDIRLELQEMTANFEVEKKFAACIEKIYESIDVTMTIYERVEQYHQNKRTTDYLAAITFAANDVELTGNPEVTKTINELDEMINSNIILAQYERAVNSFKQYIFPFADLFMRDYHLPKSLQVTDSAEVIRHILKRLEGFKKKVSISNMSIDSRIDHDYHTAKFSGRFRSSKPFYVWKNGRYKHIISKLLSGKEVVLKADIMKSPHKDKNAIKFNLIEIRFKVIKKSLQHDLDDVLKSFKVIMTHMGNSYYECDDKYYVINSASQVIKYSFEKDAGEPIHSNDVYKKLRSGDIMLSPFTMWRLKLVIAHGRMFGDLDKFKNVVDLELVGQGRYVERNSTICSSNLEEYYTLVNPIYYSVDILPNVRSVSYK